MKQPRIKFPMIAVLGLLAAAASILAVPVFSYSPLQTSGATPQAYLWSMTAFPLQWNLNPSVGANITGLENVQTVIASGFNTWVTAPNAAITITQGADSLASQESTSPANVNLICFVCNDIPFGGSETLAVTIPLVATGAGFSDNHGGLTQFAGQLVKADIVFNPLVAFNTDGTGTSGAQDLLTVATHEIGHFFGLDHSAVTRAVMYPFAPDLLTSLSYDDVAGISFLYPKGTPDVAVGSIAGTVTLNNTGVFGAHVFASSTSNADLFLGFSSIRKTPIGALTLPDGTYIITGVPGDTYVVIAEPLDLPVDDSNVNWAFEYGQAQVQTDFTTRWH